MTSQIIQFDTIIKLTTDADLQRRAYNNAFAAAELDWSWSKKDYLRMLGKGGGLQRIIDYAAEQDADVDAAAILSDQKIHFSILAKAASTRGRTVRFAARSANLPWAATPVVA